MKYYVNSGTSQYIFQEDGNIEYYYIITDTKDLRSRTTLPRSIQYYRDLGWLIFPLSQKYLKLHGININFS